jgi:hypothetical protein
MTDPKDAEGPMTTVWIYVEPSLAMLCYAAIRRGLIGRAAGDCRPREGEARERAHNAAPI